MHAWHSRYVYGSRGLMKRSEILMQSAVTAEAQALSAVNQCSAAREHYFTPIRKPGWVYAMRLFVQTKLVRAVTEPDAANDRAAARLSASRA